VHGPRDLGVGSTDHAPIQRRRQHAGLHPRRRDPWFEAISTGSQYSRHPPYQRPPRDTSVATALQTNRRTADNATATGLDRTSLSGTPATDNKTWQVFTCSLTAWLAAVNAKPDQRCLMRLLILVDLPTLPSGSPRRR
jgi:hypothetical protein